MTQQSFIFVAAQSSSRRLVVCQSVGPSVCLSETFVKKWPLEYQMVTKTYLPSNLCDSSDSSDSSGSCDSSDSSDSSDTSERSDTFATKKMREKNILCNFF